MDFPGSPRLLERIHRGELRLISRDTPEPSPLAHELLNARPYAFLDDAPLEERRAQAVYAAAGDRARSPAISARSIRSAIERVREEARPDPRDADELHDALLTAGWLTRVRRGVCTGSLRHAGERPPRHGARACRGQRWPVWVAAERLPELRAMHPAPTLDPAIMPPATRDARTWSREEALVEIVRGRMTIAGPTTADELADPLGVSTSRTSTQRFSRWNPKAWSSRELHSARG